MTEVRRLNDPLSTGFMEVREFTPNEAKSLLARGGRNRNTRPSRVRRYAHAMKQGQWRLNGETIKISKIRKVIDGKHRLQACVESNTNFTSYVVYDLDDDIFATIDDGATRTLADGFFVEDVPNAALIASALPMVWHCEKGTGNYLYIAPSDPGGGTKTDMLGFYNRTLAADWQEAVHAARPCRPLLSESVSAAAYYLFADKNRQAAEAFFGSLATGANLGVDDPILALRTRLYQEKYSKPREMKLRRGSILALVIHAWNAYRQKRPITHLQLRFDHKYPRVV